MLQTENYLRNQIVEQKTTCLILNWNFFFLLEFEFKNLQSYIIWIKKFTSRQIFEDEFFFAL